MNQVQKSLLFVIGVLVIVLAAVLFTKGYGVYREKRQEKEWAKKQQEITEEIVSVQMQIEELAGDSEALQAFLDEKVNSVLVLEERQADEQGLTGQDSAEPEPEMPEGGQDAEAPENSRETAAGQDEAQEVSSGAIVIGMEETPMEEMLPDQQGGNEDERGSEQTMEEEPPAEEVSRQDLEAAAGGAIIIDAPPAPKPPVVIEEPASEDNGEEEETVSGNELTEPEEEETVSGNELKEPEEEEETVSGNELKEPEEEEETVSGNELKEPEEEEETVSGNELKEPEEEETVSGNELKEPEEEEETVSGNELKEPEEEDTISGNAVVDGRVIPFVSADSAPTLEQRRNIRSSYQETTQMNGEDKEIINNNSLDFSETKIACLGDSLTEGSNLDKMENYQQYSYPSVLKNILQAEEVYNLGIGGSSYGRYWDNAFVDRYREIPQDVDIIVVMGGTNDGFAASEKELGSFEEKKGKTFYGDVDELMRGLKENYPEAKIIFATPLPNVLHDYLRNQRNYLLPQSVYAKAIKELAAQYQIDVVDLYNSNLLDTHDAEVITHYMPDGVHANPEGYQILAEHLARNIIEIVERDESGEGIAHDSETVSGNGLYDEDEAETVSGNGMVENGEETVSGNGSGGENSAGTPEQTLTPEEIRRREEERLREERERIAREREEAAKAAENNKKVAEDAVVITPAQEVKPAESAEPEQPAQGSDAPDEEEREPEPDYEYGGEAILIQ